MAFIRVTDILQTTGQSRPIPNFKELGFVIGDAQTNQCNVLDSTIANIAGPPVRRHEQSPQDQGLLQQCDTQQSPHKKSPQDQGLRQQSPQDQNVTANDTDGRPPTLTELRKRLCSGSQDADKSVTLTKSRNSTKAPKATTAQAPLPPSAAQRFVQIAHKHDMIRDVALAIPPLEDNTVANAGRKRKRSATADIFNEDRLKGIHGWLELQVQSPNPTIDNPVYEKKSFHVVHYQPVVLDIDVKDGAMYDNLSFWIELRSIKKDSTTAIHQEDLDYIVIEGPPMESREQPETSSEQPETRNIHFYICNRKKLSEFIYTKLPEGANNTTNNPFDCEYKLYREGRKLQLKTRVPFGDLESSRALEFGL